jgi:hypothetical protein
MAIDPVLLADLKRRLAEYKVAESAILMNQSYTIKDRTFTRTDLAEVLKAIDELQQQINGMENAGNVRTRRVVFRD